MLVKRSKVFIKDLANRFGPLPMALAGGLILGLLTLTIPNSLIESVVSATGISEIISFAAPPLGIKARIAIALATASLVFGVLALLLVRDGDGQRDSVMTNEPVEDLKFASDFEKEARREAALGHSAPTKTASESPPRKPGILERVRGMMPVVRDASPEDVRELEDLPKLRREDRHPDAPPRAPLRAGRDLQDDYENKAPPAADVKDADGGTGKVANMRKRLGGLIPRDLMGDEDGDMGETPLVAKKPIASSQAEPAAPAPIAEAPRDVAQDVTAQQAAMDQTYAAPPISEPVIAKPIAAEVESDGMYVPDQPEPAKYEEPASYSDSVSAAQPEAFKEQPFQEDAAPIAASNIGSDDSAYKAPSEEPAPQKFAVVENDADDAVEPAKIARHISAPVDEISLNALNLSELIDRLEKGLERLTEYSGHEKADTSRDNAPEVDSTQSSVDNASNDQRETVQNSEQDKPAEAPKQKQQEADASQPLTDPDDMDEALRAALETLRQMTGEQRNAS